MAHEIEKTDNVVLHRQAAWHGLGVVVEKAPTPQEALSIAGLDWKVTQKAMYTRLNDGSKYVFESHVANFREDTNHQLGVVSSNYRPVQNVEMAEFCEALSEVSAAEGGEPVLCETAGSVRNGQRVWFLLKGETFQVARDDEIVPYILVSNGHDGKSSFRVTPTTVRVVCSNTLHSVIPKYDTGKLVDAAISVRHTQSVLGRIEEARLALRAYNDRMKKTEDLMGRLFEYQVNTEKMTQFFSECYARDFGEVSTNPQTRKEKNARDRAVSAFQSFTRRFDDEREIAGASLWCALNAYSGMVQHDKKARGKDDESRVWKRVDSNLFGLNQARTQHALANAVQWLVRG